MVALVQECIGYAYRNIMQLRHPIFWPIHVRLYTHDICVFV